eukprot:156481-Prorocentrum_minimum.AAC.2
MEEEEVKPYCQPEALTRVRLAVQNRPTVLSSRCICVLRDALCFTSVIRSWGPKASHLIV